MICLGNVYGSKSSAQQKIPGIATERNLEKDSIWTNQISLQAKQDQSAKNISWFLINSCQKRGDVTEYDWFKQITGTKIHVAVEQKGLPVSIIIPANKHDSTRFIDAMENISEYLDDDVAKQIIQFDQQFEIFEKSKIFLGQYNFGKTIFMTIVVVMCNFVLPSLLSIDF